MAENTRSSKQIQQTLEPQRSFMVDGVSINKQQALLLLMEEMLDKMLHFTDLLDRYHENFKVFKQSFMDGHDQVEQEEEENAVEVEERMLVSTKVVPKEIPNELPISPVLRNPNLILISIFSDSPLRLSFPSSPRRNESLIPSFALFIPLEVVTKYKRAVEIVESECKPKVKIVDNCGKADLYIREQAGNMYKKVKKKIKRGVVFPICISVNVTVGHFSRLASDETVLEEGDMLKIDISCHIDGFIAVVAHSHVLQEGPVTGSAADVVVAINIAAEVTLRLVRPKGKNKDVIDTIQKVAVAYDCKIFEGGLRHQLKLFVIDGNQVVLSHFDAYVAPIYIPLSFPLLVVCILDSGSLLFQWFPWMHFECRRVFDCLVDVRELFEKMPHRDVESWNAIFLVFDEWPLQGVFEPFDRGRDYLAEVEYDIVVVISGLFGNILMVSLATIMSSRSELTRIWDPGDAQVASGGGRVQITVSYDENGWEAVNVPEEPILWPLDRGWKNGMVGNHLVWLYSTAIQPEFPYLPSPVLPMFWRFPDIPHNITRLFHRPSNPFEFIVAIQANLWAGKQLQEFHLEEENNIKKMRAKTVHSQLLKKLILLTSTSIIIDRTMKLLPTQVDTTAGGWHCTALTDKGQVYGGERGESWVGVITVYKAIVQLDEMHDAYEKLLKEAGEDLQVSILANLQKLSIQVNKIHSLPSSVCEMKSLCCLDAHFNELHGVSIAVGRLTNLESLNLSSNFTIFAIILLSTITF